MSAGNGADDPLVGVVDVVGEKTQPFVDPPVVPCLSAVNADVYVSGVTLRCGADGLELPTVRVGVLTAEKHVTHCPRSDSGRVVEIYDDCVGGT